MERTIRSNQPGSCVKSADGEHDYIETTRNIYDYVGTEVFITKHCTRCGKRRIDVDYRRE